MTGCEFASLTVSMIKCVHGCTHLSDETKSITNILLFNSQMETGFYTVFTSSNNSNMDILSESLNIASIGGEEYGAESQEDLVEDQENNGWADKFQSHTYDTNE